MSEDFLIGILEDRTPGAWAWGLGLEAALEPRPGAWSLGLGLEACPLKHRWASALDLRPGA